MGNDKAIELTWKRGFLIARMVDMINRDCPDDMPADKKTMFLNMCLKKLEQPEITAREQSWINDQSKWEGLALTKTSVPIFEQK